MSVCTETALRQQLQPSDLDELTLLATGLHATRCTPTQAVNRLLTYAAQGIDAAELYANDDAQENE